MDTYATRDDAHQAAHAHGSARSGADGNRVPFADKSTRGLAQVQRAGGADVFGVLQGRGR